MLEGFCKAVNDGVLRREVKDLERIEYRNPREEQLIKALIAREMERRENVRKWMAHPGLGLDPRILGEGKLHGNWTVEEPKGLGQRAQLGKIEVTDQSEGATEGPRDHSTTGDSKEADQGPQAVE